MGVTNKAYWAFCRTKNAHVHSHLPSYTFRPPKDPYYDQETEDKDLRKEKEAKQTKERMQYVKRVIVHPAFHNISFAEAEKLMDKMAQGEVIVRPSSKVCSTNVARFSNDLYHHH